MKVLVDKTNMQGNVFALKRPVTSMMTERGSSHHQSTIIEGD